ncbi:MAG: phosphoribosylformylglycinamidine cyclo-ligase [Chloroflexi bacterium CG_4_9_14_3_um_filter_45_9]|nr:MAG: phosphoribosylformylglycinamidine cyclo-ligase [Dehalococcoidia bacterium CG2_30_46_9]PIU23085.1 MAG: phosphoribosylformylglycinamidine cyclo-ligase [Chloroflexi bacterium CG08_land_8_20_14_0_20_45_12]PIX27206.1 MAG: phosphoribosylformylglycinamidine cyclo-ligase [Chloroflexi bacterium CG_4_8_14_3_um_filter_45_15]PJB50911.1 MAG: phosphoribosylformylglycinamidine cyclo-ligase [Chloroflexi bacterium CG_4_9_14_3_um_filter_45_9]
MAAKFKGVYAAAGVGIDVANKIKENIAKQVSSTLCSSVLNFGSFGSIFKFEGYNEPVLVSSVDGVGTKLKIASLLNKHDTVGMDIVNHCVNDILCCGARPLFFLDYIAMEKLVPEQIEAMVAGMVKACKEVGCSLIGGETAEMPGIYCSGNYDLVGFIVGVVEKGEIIDGSPIVAGDVILGLPSSGLHTNGYSLVRHIFRVEEDSTCLYRFYPELGKTLGEELLQVHRCYYQELKTVLPLIKGLAHITGGGFIGNIPRVLPRSLAAHLYKGSWDVPPIFNIIQEKGNIDEAEMYRVFNMGIGMVIICSPQEANKLTGTLSETRVIGEIVKTQGKEGVTFD